MSFSEVKSVLIRLHRWAGLALAPVFLLVILSGAVLSLRPIASDLQTAAAASGSVDIAALQTLVGRLGTSATLNSLVVSDGGRTVAIAGGGGNAAGLWNIASAEKVAASGGGVDVFAVAERLHKSLLLGLGFVVEGASFVMLALMLVGPLLSWLRFRNSLIGWHRAIGWCSLPVSIIAPLTAVLMVLGIGQGARVPLPATSQPVSIASALEIAARDADLSHLVSARQFRGGTVLLQTSDASYVVTDTKAVLLTGGPGLVKQIHEGTWAGAWSGAFNLLISLILLLLTLTGLLSWFRRFRRERRAEPSAGRGDVLVAYASQTGTAARLAGATAAALRKTGTTVDLASLGMLEPEALGRYGMALLLVASTGEGEVPDAARRFMRLLKARRCDGVRFAMLGLGDRSYEKFCGGAETLRDALLAAGAREERPLARADCPPEPAWHAWIAQICETLGLNAVPLDRADRAGMIHFRVVDRQRMDDPGAGDTQETWAVTLEGDVDGDFRPGDLVRLVPAPGERDRAYSVGSSSRVDARRIELTVRLHQWQDEQGRSGFGRMSEMLVRSLPIGGVIEGRLESHPTFNPPGDPSWPIIMIGTGSGIAPFPGFISERRASGKAGPAWLLFGNRHRAADFLWQDELEKALQDGALTRLDTAFSRDEGGRRLPACLMELGPELHRWIVDAGAIVYICGRRDMARAVLAALADVLSTGDALPPASAEEQIEHWLAEGRIRIDAFD